MAARRSRLSIAKSVGQSRHEKAGKGRATAAEAPDGSAFIYTLPVRVVRALLIASLVLGFVGCKDSSKDRVLVIGGASVGEATLVAGFHEIAVSTREPNYCVLVRGQTGTAAFNVFIKLLFEASDATPTLVPAGGDANRAGDLLVQQCQKFYENRKP